MKSIRFIIICCFISSALAAQRLHIGVFGGLAAYNGDLTEKVFPKKVTNGAIGITGNYEIADQIMLKAGLTYAVVGGADRFSDKPEAVLRNLAFETSVTELSVVGEYYLLNLYERKYSPYVFAGLAIYHYNPYAANNTSQKIYLRPLSTEGQGLSGYPDRNVYSLTQMAIPFGGGMKYVLNPKYYISFEIGIRKTFFD